MEGLLTELLEAHGYRVAPVTVPKKLLAVCSGLAEYGRNNVTYIEGMGSFYRLATFRPDLPFESDEWRDPKAMEQWDLLELLDAMPRNLAPLLDRWVT